MKFSRFAGLMLLTGFLHGCAAPTGGGDRAATTEFAVPATFDNSRGLSSAIQADWLTTFEDPRLNSLVDEVLANNFDLQIAAANVDAAEAAARIAGAASTPAVNLGLQAGGQGNLDNGGDTALGASLDVSWELDVWGRIRAGQNAASEDLIATELDFQFARQSLAAQTAKAYFLAVESAQQLDLAEEVVANYEKTLEVVEAFYEEGVSGSQDRSLARSEYARAQDSLESTRSAHLAALRSLEFLLGRYPSADVDVAQSLPALPEPVPAGIPSDVLERRPDIVAAERRVAAAFSRIDEAQAAKLPRITLTGGISGAGSELSNIVDPANVLWNAASSLMFPIFDGGRLDAELDRASAAQRQALSNYQKTALQVFGDIEAALTDEAIFQRRVLNLQETYEQSKIAEEIGFERYQSGEGNLLDLQQLQRGTISAQSALLRVKQELLAQRVNLHLGLGGSF